MVEVGTVNITAESTPKAVQWKLKAVIKTNSVVKLMIVPVKHCNYFIVNITQHLSCNICLFSICFCEVPHLRVLWTYTMQYETKSHLTSCMAIKSLEPLQ